MRALVLGGGELAAAVERSLAPHGFTVQTMAEVSELAAVVDPAGCALVLFDADGPDAEATCRAVATLPGCADAVLVAVTSARAPVRLAALFAAGATDVLALPADGDRLVGRALSLAARDDVGPRLFRAVFAHVPVAMALVDAETLRFLQVSEGAARQYGWSRQEFLGLTLRDIRPADAIPALEHALQQSGPTLLVTTHRKKDGTTFFSRGVLHGFEIGARRFFLAVSLDVTEEMRTADAQRRSLEAYQELVERSADCVFTHRADLTIEYANPAFAALLGFDSPGQLVGIPVLELCHPDDREAIRGRIRSILESGAASPPRAIRFLARDGTQRWAETRGIRVMHDGQPAVTVIARDLSERRAAEEALRASEERFSRIFQASPAGISMTRVSDQRFVEVNERFTQMTGYRRDEVVGRTGLEIGLWFDRADRDRVYQVIREQGRVRDHELAMRNKSGERVDVLLSAELVEVGGEPCVLTLAIDISERKRLDEQLRHAHKMEGIGRLAGGIAHDFNNLLTGIRGYSELLLEQLPPGSSGRDAVRHIHRAALRAASLTGQLLVFTRRQTVQPEVLVVDDVVRQMGAMLRRIIGADVALELELGAGTARVRADRTHLEQVILNLAVNARDAMPRGGQLVISTGAEGAHEAAQVWLRVRDTGTGMDPEVRARIFEPFFTTKEVGQGTGLGLSIVYGIVEQSGGTITVDTVRGEGTTFFIRLPRVDAPAAAAADPTPPRAPRGHEVVLVVEDDDDVRDFVVLVLRRAGYEVLVAEDGVEALEQAARRPDLQLLLSDVVMPRMSGYELAAELRRRNPAVKVLHMSGYPGPPGHGAPVEPAPFLQKPFASDELLGRVRAVLESDATAA